MRRPDVHEPREAPARPVARGRDRRRGPDPRVVGRVARREHRTRDRRGVEPVGPRPRPEGVRPRELRAVPRRARLGSGGRQDRRWRRPPLLRVGGTRRCPQPGGHPSRRRRPRRGRVCRRARLVPRDRCALRVGGGPRGRVRPAVAPGAGVRRGRAGAPRRAEDRAYHGRRRGRADQERPRGDRLGRTRRVAPRRHGAPLNGRREPSLRPVGGVVEGLGQVRPRRPGEDVAPLPQAERLRGHDLDPLLHGARRGLGAARVPRRRGRGRGRRGRAAMDGNAGAGDGALGRDALPHRDRLPRWMGPRLRRGGGALVPSAARYARDVDAAGALGRAGVEAGDRRAGGVGREHRPVGRGCDGLGRAQVGGGRRDHAPALRLGAGEPSRARRAPGRARARRADAPHQGEGRAGQGRAREAGHGGASPPPRARAVGEGARGAEAAERGGERADDREPRPAPRREPRAVPRRVSRGGPARHGARAVLVGLAEPRRVARRSRGRLVQGDAPDAGPRPPLQPAPLGGDHAAAPGDAPALWFAGRARPGLHLALPVLVPAVDARAPEARARRRARGAEAAVGDGDEVGARPRRARAPGAVGPGA